MTPKSQKSQTILTPSTGPKGTQPPPRPDLPLIIGRVALLLMILLLCVEPWAVRWTAPVPAHTNGASFGALLHRVFTPPLLYLPVSIVFVGGVGLVLELFWAAVSLVGQSYVAGRVQTTYLRVRTPQPLPGRTGRTSETGEDLFHTLHRMLPLYQRSAWLALTLSARPDESVAWGVVISGGRAAQRASWAAQFRKIITGLQAEALVDEPNDPLQQALQTGGVLVWKEFTLFHPPSYPLRLPNDADTDLLMPLVSALRGRLGTAYSEVQITLRPRHDWDLTNGWRVYALRCLLQLRAKHQYYLNPDMDALQDKIDNPAYDVSVRLLVVARTKSQLAEAQADLDEVGAILLSQYQARSGTRLQRFLAVGGRTLTVPAAVLAPSNLSRQTVRTLLVWLAGSAAALWTMLGLGALAPHGVSPWLGMWRVLPEPILWQASIAHSLPSLLALAAGFGTMTLLDRWQSTLSGARVWRVITRSPRATPPHPLVLPLRAWRGPSVLSAAELGGLWHLPTAAMGMLVRWLPCRFLPAPPHAFVPPAAEEARVRGFVSSLHRLRNAALAPEASPTTSETRIIVGHARRGDGSTAPVGLTLRDLRQIMHLTAGMGAGKSRFLANICQQLLPHGFILADGKGDDDAGSLVATVRRLIPREAEARLIILDVLDTDWPMGINPLAGIDLVRPGGVDMALGQILAIFGRLDPEVWVKSMGMQQYIRMGALLVLEGEIVPTMAHIKQALMDDQYRATLLKRCTNIEVCTFWTMTFSQTSDQQRVSLEALLRRFDNLLATETTRYLLTQPLTTFDVRQAMDDGLIVLIPMPDMTLGGMAGLVGMLAIQAIVRAAFQRRGSDQTRTTYPLIVDEFQVFLNTGATEDVSTAMTRLRSLGIGGIYAHQSLTQLGDLEDVMLINAQSRIILRTQEPDASKYGRQYAASGLTGIDIANQDANEHQYAVLQCAGQTAGPLSLRPLPWPQPQDVTVAAYQGLHWQDMQPLNRTRADDAIVQLVYGTYTPRHFQRIVAGLAKLSDEAWAYLMGRWQAISAHQRQYILDHPGCIADQLERQKWLSRLRAARPRVLVAAAYQRQRWMVAPSEKPARVSAPARQRNGATDGQRTPRPGKDITETWRIALPPQNGSGEA